MNYREFIENKFQTIMQCCEIFKDQIIRYKRTVKRICIYTVLFWLLLALFENFFLEKLFKILIANEFIRLDFVMISVETWSFICFVYAICMTVILFILIFELSSLKSKNISLKHIKRKTVCDISLMGSIIIQLFFCIYLRKNCALLIFLGIYIILDLYPELFRTGKLQKDRRKLRYNSIFFKVVYFMILSVIVDVIITYYSPLVDCLALLTEKSPIGTISGNIIPAIINLVVDIISGYSMAKNSKRVLEFSGIPLESLGYQDKYMQYNSMVKYIIVVFMIIELVAAFFRLIVPVACTILIIVLIGMVYYFNENISMEDKKAMFESSINQEIAAFQKNENSNQDSTYFTKVLLYNYKCRIENSMSDNIEEIKSAYDITIKCIQENVDNNCVDKQGIFLSNWKYIKLSVENFIDAINLQGSQNKENMKLAVELIYLFINKCFQADVINDFKLLQLASIVKLIFKNTRDIKIVILFCNKFEDMNIKYSCFYFLIIIYIHIMVYDDARSYNIETVKKDIRFIMREKGKLGCAEFDRKKRNRLNSVFVVGVKECDNAHEIICIMQDLQKIEEKEILNLMAKIVGYETDGEESNYDI